MWELLEQGAEVAAPALLGATLTHGETSGVIIETEAYFEADPASHTFRGRTPRTEPMFGPAGHAYVYFIYGMHFCMNVTCGPEGRGEAVLIRALRPLAGIELMQMRRRTVNHGALCNGPANLTQALGITKEQNGMPLRLPPLFLEAPAEKLPFTRTPRIGINVGTEALLRFCLL